MSEVSHVIEGKWNQLCALSPQHMSIGKLKGVGDDEIQAGKYATGR